MKNAILHTFNWKYSEIIDKMEEIEKAGYGAILIPPILYSDTNGTAWWQRYQPKDYRVLLSFLGNKKELEQIIEKAHMCKIRVYADMVINHMAYENREDGFDFPGKQELENYKNNKNLFEENKLYGDLTKGLFKAQDFNRRGNIVNWSNRTEVIYHRLSNLPDLSCNYWVLSQHRELFQKLDEMRFDGFRIDALKHISLNQLKNITELEFMKDKFVFGEILTVTRHDEDVFLKPFMNESEIDAYDFPLYRTIRKAFAIGGSMKSLISPEQNRNALPWNRAVTFTCNHDLPLNNAFRSLLLEKQDEHLANIYIFGRDGGVPLVFSDHNESATDFPEDKDRWANSFNRADIKAMLKFHNAVHGEKMYSVYETDNCIIFRRGEKGIVAINKSEEHQHLYFNTYGLKRGYFTDTIHKHSLQIQSDGFLLYIPPRTGQMWLFNE